MKRFFALLISLLLIFGSMPLGVLAETEKEEYITISLDSDYYDNDELFAGYVERAFYPETAVSAWGISARDRLSAKEKRIYDWLKTNIVNIASGKQKDARFTTESSELSKWTEVTFTFSSNVADNFFAQFDYRKIIDALLCDFPYDLYWFDKATGFQFGVSMRGNTVISVTAILQVCVGYRASYYDSEYPKVATGTLVSQSVANAKALVNKYADYSDLQKLVAYRDEICALTEYNYDAMEDIDPDYGDPWQLIHVFDGDPATDVVCEGYSKAFKYLCDNTEFDSSLIECYLVVGDTNGGGHMWNIITMPDNQNYLVDITNSDSGAIGQNGGLFLAGMSGSVTSGYSKTFYSTLTYTYDDDMLALWGTGSDSILKLASADYAFIELDVETTDREYNGSYLSVDTYYADVVYSIKNENISDYNVSVQWYEGEYLLGLPPKDAGEYSVSVTVTHKTNSTKKATETRKITISPATIEIVGAICLNKEYDGNTTAQVDTYFVSNIFGDDELYVTAAANFLSAAVGEKTSILVDYATLSGRSAKNYVLSQTFYLLDIDPVYITKVSNVAAPEFNWIYTADESGEAFVYTIYSAEGCEYRMDDGEWQDSNQFFGIAPETVHSFYARKKETDISFAGAISTSGSIYFQKLDRADIPVIDVELSDEDGGKTITIRPIDGAEYSFDGGITWSDNNVLNGINNQVIDCAIRYKATPTTNPSVAVSVKVDVAKTTQAAPEVFDVTYTLNPDRESYTMTIPFMENALYSFDGINYSESNVKTDCLPGAIYTIYVKFAETDEFVESAATVVYVIVPEVPDYIKGDINNSGVIDSMDYVLLKRAYFGTYKIANEIVGDINNSGDIDSMDYVLLKRAYFGTYVIV